MRKTIARVIGGYIIFVPIEIALIYIGLFTDSSLIDWTLYSGFLFLTSFGLIVLTIYSIMLFKANKDK